LLFLDDHLDRLLQGARAIELEIGMDRAQIAAALACTAAANGMSDGVHMRLMVTRGLKATVNQDPRNALGQPTMVITAEYKIPSAGSGGGGLSLATSSVRCSPAEMFDMRLNSHSRLNLIRALLDAIRAGADEALMLDPAGFVSSCNATNFFCVRDGTVRTSDGKVCFNGITRQKIIDLCRASAIPIRLGELTLAEARGAEEAFVTGTLGGVTPVRELDGHRMAGTPGPVTARLRELYAGLMDGM
jgi:branched-chain amino acid aminotransferase